VNQMSEKPTIHPTCPSAPIAAPNSQVNRKQSDSRAVVNIKPFRAKDMLRSNVPIARRRTEEERPGLRNSRRRSCLMGVARGEAGIQRAPTQANLRNQALTDKAHGCCTRNVELFRLNPNP
jgi:hypothetical protein